MRLHVPKSAGSVSEKGVQKSSVIQTGLPAGSLMELQRALGNRGMQQVLRALVQQSDRGLQAGPEQALGQPAADTQRGNRNAVVQAQFRLQKEAVATPSESEVAEQAIQLEEAPDQRIPNRTGLPDQLKAGVESLSSISLDDVKVHYNSAKPAELNALAYAQGTDIHLAPGQEQHFPHEAWHIVQQKQGRVKPTVQMRRGIAINDDVALEKEADAMGAKARKGNGDRHSGTQSDMQASAFPVVQRYVTFNSRQKEPFILDKQGMAGYDRSNVDSLGEELQKEGLRLSLGEIIKAFGPLLTDQRDICFKDYRDAAAWVAQEANPETAGEVKGQPGGLIRAFRIEGQPKSKKQESDAFKHIPGQVIKHILGDMSDLSEECKEALRLEWKVIADAPNAKKKASIEKLKKSRTYKKEGIDVEELITRGFKQQEKMQTEISGGGLNAFPHGD